MVNFLLNGKVCGIEKNESLIRFLRDKEELISVKNGCGEGACGACMVLVDGKATRACILKGDKPALTVSSSVTNKIAVFLKLFECRENGIGTFLADSSQPAGGELPAIIEREHL